MTAAVALPNAFPEKLHLIDELKSENFALSSFYTMNESETWAAAFAPDNSYFAWSCGHRAVVIVPWKANDKVGRVDEASAADTGGIIEEPKTPLIIQCNDFVWSITFGTVSSDSSVFKECSDFYNFRAPSNHLVLAIGLECGRIRLYSIRSAKFITELIDHTNVVRQLQFSPDGSLNLLSASRDSTLKLWDLLDDCNMFKTLLYHGQTEWVMCCAWSPCGKYLASGGSENTLFVYRKDDWTLFRNLRGHVHTVSSCEFSPDGALLASAAYDTTVILWNFVASERLATFNHLLPPPRPVYASGANEFYIRSLSFSSQGEFLSTVCDDGFLRVWSIFESDYAIVAAAEIHNAVCTQFSPDGGCLSVGTREGHVHLFASPMRVQSLLQISRRAVRKRVAYDGIEFLPICPLLKSYLRYNL